MGNFNGGVDIKTSNFWVHYWPSLAWIGAAVLAIIILIATFSSPGNPPTLGVVVLLFGAVRTFMLGGRADTSDMQGTENKILAWLFQWAFGAVLWPLAEIFRQLRFLARAGSAWRQGQVLVSEKNPNQPVRAA